MSAAAWAYNNSGGDECPVDPMMLEMAKVLRNGATHRRSDSLPRCNSSNTATPSGPQTQASPSSVNDCARSFSAVTAIAG
jgi:hypothetical protein